MKKTRLFGMFALTFALVFGAVSCAQPTGDNVADVKDDAASLVGKWKCTVYEVESDGSVDDSLKELFGKDTDTKVEITDAFKATFDFELKDEAAAKAWVEEMAKEVEAFEKSKETQKTAMKAGYELLGALGGFKVDDVDLDGEYSVTINKDRTEIVEETSQSYSVTFSKDGNSVSASESGSTKIVWEKQ